MTTTYITPKSVETLQSENAALRERVKELEAALTKAATLAHNRGLPQIHRTDFEFCGTETCLNFRAILAKGDAS